MLGRLKLNTLMVLHRCAAPIKKNAKIHVKFTTARQQTLWGLLFVKISRAPFDDGARSLAIIHPGIVRRSTGEPWRGPDECGIRVHDGNAAPDPVSKSEKARL